MFRIHTAYSTGRVKDYFKVADYYADGPETVGFWHGDLCREFGVEPGDEVSHEDFARLCDNINPATGKRLTLRTNQFRRVGDDMIFSLVKDVSAFIMLIPPELRELRDALLDLVERRALEVCDLIEDSVETRVRKGGAFDNRPGDGMAFAVHRHTTARQVGKWAPDPHVHWHGFAVNATRDGVEGGRKKAYDVARIYEESGYYESEFLSRVAYDFAGLGLPVVIRENGKWGIAGLESLIPKFSKRTNEVEDEAKRLNITDAEEKDGLGARLRKKKDKALTQEQLREEWDDQLTPEERETLERLWRLVGSGEAEAARPAVSAREAVEFAYKHCREKLSNIPVREFKRVALLHSLGSVSPEMIDAEMHDPRHGFIFGEIRGRQHLTTEALQAEETQIADDAARGIGAVAPIGLSPVLDRTLADGKTLTDDQWSAVTGLLTSPNRINVLEGPAGAGKSKLMDKLDEGIALAGGQITYLATTVKAADVLGHGARTVASFLRDERTQAASVGGRVLVDEVSMLGHADLRDLLAVGKKHNLKFIFSGDRMQHGSVARGATLRLLTEKGTIAPIRLAKILRQQDPDHRDAAQKFSEGRATEGVDALDRKGWISEIADPAERFRTIACDYAARLKACGGNWQDVLVISPIHAEAGAITAAIRRQLREAGTLGEERPFTRLVQVDTSEAERGRAYTYRQGDVLVFHQNARGGFTRGDRLVVTDPAKVPLSEAGKFAVYRRESDTLAVGDLVRRTGAGKTLGANPRVLKNGHVAAVAGFTEAGNIVLDSGDVVSKDDGMWRHGRVETSMGSQGRTVRHVLLDMSAAMGKAANMQQLYVSVTRSTESVRVYADDLASVKKAAERDSRQLLALDLKPGLPSGEKRRLGDLARRQQRGVLDRIAADWADAWGKLWERQPGPPPPPPDVPPPSHVGRWQARQQERGYGLGR
jgi:conjugative relaxase-like TrwC/TraI family protein